MSFLKEDWSELFKENIDAYMSGRPKRGVFIKNHLYFNGLTNGVSTCLEQGAFSAKDSIYLKTVFPHWQCTATDNDNDVVNYIDKTDITGQEEDAFNLSFNDCNFDLTFQSGLIIYYSNEQAFDIIKEQLRVTAKLSFVFAHNKSNYIDRFVSFLKRNFLHEGIHHFRRYSDQDLASFAIRLGYKFEVIYYDNMLINFSNRNCSWLTSLLVKLKVDKLQFLSNEIVLVIHK